MSLEEQWMMLNDPDTMWAAYGVMLQAIQTIILLVSAIFVLFQVRQIRMETVEKKIIGLKTAIEALETEFFKKVVRDIGEGKQVHGTNWRRILDSINFVVLLIQERFTNEKLLLTLKGQDLLAISKYIERYGLPEDLKDELELQYNPAVVFMKSLIKKEDERLAALENLHPKDTSAQ